MSEADTIRHRERMKKAKVHLDGVEFLLSTMDTPSSSELNTLKAAVEELHKAVNEIQEAL